MIGLLFIFFHIQSLRLVAFYISLLKSYEKCFLFYLNCSFGSCNVQVLGESSEVENGITMTSWNGLCKLPTLIFGKTRKPSFS